jgi:hypothetical protein
MFKIKDFIAKFIVILTIGGIVGSLASAFYMGGWKAFLTFMTACGIVFFGIVLIVLIIWAFRRVFAED